MKRRAALILLMTLLAGCRKHPRIRSAIEQDQVRPPAEWLKNESVRLLRDYVRINTDSRGPGELDGAVFLQRFFDCAGIPTELVCPAPRRCNLLARIAGKKREGALLLLNHIDVVSAFPSYWMLGTPFGGEIKIGYLYGRGSYDMKAIGIAQAIAMRRLKEAGIVPESDILFLGEADEEFEQRWGSKWMLENRPEWFQGVTAVLNEGGTNELILRDLRYWGVETVQAGYGSLEIEADGPEPLKAVADQFRKLPGDTVPPHPQVVEAFGLIANHLPPPFTGWLRDLESARHDPRALRELPDRYGAFLQPRIHWSDPYIFPPGQNQTFREYAIISVPVGVSPDPYLAQIEEGIRRMKGIRIHERVSSGPTTASPYPTEFTDLLKRVSTAFHPGIPFGPDPGFGGITTSVHFRRRGIPAYGYAPILMNITDTSRRHGNDERVFLRDYLNGVEIYDQVVKEFAFQPVHKTSPVLNGK